MKTLVLLAGVLLVLGGCEAFQSFTASPGGQDALRQGAEAAATAIGVAFPAYGMLAAPILGIITNLILGGKK